MANRDPHRILGVGVDASQSIIKAAWRRLARANHPDLAPDESTRDQATRRMAEINAAYEELRVPGRRGSHAGRSGSGGGGSAAGRDAASGGRGSAGGGAGGGAAGGDANQGSGRTASRPEYERPSGPPPDPPTPPVTARLDTTPTFRQRNATTTPAGGGFRHHPRTFRAPLRARTAELEARRASDPNGPLERTRPRRPPRRERPPVDVALATEIGFGKFSGWSLGAIAVVEPTYLEWVERTIMRDPDLVAAIRVVLADMGRPSGDPRE